jgi:hypothetical protein
MIHPESRPPFFMQRGTAGDIVPYQQSLSFAAKLAAQIDQER